jgi:hypothetical protein
MRNQTLAAMPEGRPIQETPDRPAAGFQRFYGMLLQGFPERDDAC